MDKQDNGHKHLVDWLRDAHAMERTAEKMLETQLKGLGDDYPEMARRVRSHLDETRIQAERVEQCLSRLDSDTSTTKDLMGRLASALGLMNAAANDEPVKHHLSGYTLEHQEIACYRSIIAAARHLGENEIAATCEQSLREEEQMAEWLDQRLEETTIEFLVREQRRAA